MSQSLLIFCWKPTNGISCVPVSIQLNLSYWPLANNKQIPTFLESRFPCLQHKIISEQRSPVNNGY